MPRTMRRIASPYRAVSLTSSPGMYTLSAPSVFAASPRWNPGGRIVPGAGAGRWTVSADRDVETVRHVRQGPPGQRLLEPGLGIRRDLGEGRAHGHADRTAWICRGGVRRQQGFAGDGQVDLGQADLGGGSRQAISTVPPLEGFAPVPRGRGSPAPCAGRSRACSRCQPGTRSWRTLAILPAARAHGRPTRTDPAPCGHYLRRIPPAVLYGGWGRLAIPTYRVVGVSGCAGSWAGRRTPPRSSGPPRSP